MNHSNTRTASGSGIRRPSGLTLLEMTVVIGVFLTLLGLLFTATRAWKEDADRSGCIMNQSKVQKAMRGHAYMYGYEIGSSIFNLPSKLIGPGRYIESVPPCPLHGTYTFGTEHGQDTVPPIGTIYMRCSMADSDGHQPSSYGDW